MAFRLKLINPLFTSLKYNKLPCLLVRAKSKKSNQSEILWQQLTESSSKPVKITKEPIQKSDSESDWFKDLTGPNENDESPYEKLSNVTSREILNQASSNEKRMVMQRMIDVQLANDFSLPKDLTEDEWAFLDDKKSFGQIKKGLE